MLRQSALVVVCLGVGLTGAPNARAASPSLPAAATARFDEVTGAWRFVRESPSPEAPSSRRSGATPAISAGWSVAPSARVHPETTNQHLWPDIAVGPGGVAGTVWLDDHLGGTYHIFYSRSTDGGLTWSIPEQVDKRTTGSISKSPSLGYTPGGVPVVVWEDDRLGPMNVYFSKRDPSAGGSPWTADLMVNATGGAPYTSDFMNPSVAVLDGERFFVAWGDWREGVFTQVYTRATQDGGLTWGSEHRISDEIGYQPLAADPCLIVDPASGTPGTEVLYCVMDDWRGDVPGGRYPNVYFSRSTDGGTTWSNGVRVNDIEPYYQQTSSRALVELPDGTLTSAWLNNEVGPSQFRASVSTDGGATWGASVQVNPSVGSGVGTWSSITSSGDWVFAGFDLYESDWNSWFAASSDGGRTWAEGTFRMDDDTTGAATGNTVVAAASPTEIYGAWQDTRPGYGPWLIFATRVSGIETGVGPTADSDTSDRSPSTAQLLVWPNPLHDAGELSILLKPGTAPPPGVARMVVIFDSVGRRLRALSLSRSGAATWNGTDKAGRSVSPGIYWARLDDGGPATPIVVLH